MTKAIVLNGLNLVRGQNGVQELAAYRGLLTGRQSFLARPMARLARRVHRVCGHGGSVAWAALACQRTRRCWSGRNLVPCSQ
jgi:hypothetical protein